ncbi:MAG: hypothetical protein AB8G95_24800 [Anaerolineae bacterium]
MFENRLANSIQQDFRQAADNHRLSKDIGNVSNRFNRMRLTIPVTIGGILLAVFLTI